MVRITSHELDMNNSIRRWRNSFLQSMVQRGHTHTILLHSRNALGRPSRATRGRTLSPSSPPPPFSPPPAAAGVCRRAKPVRCRRRRISWFPPVRRLRGADLLWWRGTAAAGRRLPRAVGRRAADEAAPRGQGGEARWRCALAASFYRYGGLRRAGWSSGRLCGGSWRRGCRRCPLPFGRHAESGPIWVCHGPGGPVVARNGRGEVVVPGQWMSVLAVARC
jgi:hypothetical protein